MVNKMLQTRDELRYTPYGVDPKEVRGEDFPRETFRVLKEKEIKQFGDAPQSDVQAGVGGVGFGLLGLVSIF